MKIDKALLATIIFVLAFLAGFYLGQYIKISLYSKEIPAQQKTISALFVCDGDKTISAKFIGSSVFLTLSDDRRISLSQSISASGARYTNEDESFVFWNKGNTAFIQEGENYTYENCVTE